jgi:hypothetical protein
MPTLQVNPSAIPTTNVAALEVSVVMPCLNEARTVGKCVDNVLLVLRDLSVDGEVIVADNGSTDASAEIAGAHGARVVHVSRRGYGSALQGGIEAARGRYVFMGDADESYDFGELGLFLERLRCGDELVVGNRFRGGIRPGAMPWLHRYVGNPVLTGVLNLFYRSPIGDAHCGLRAIRKDAYCRLGLNTNGMEFASEMVVKACLHGLRISEVPVVLHPDGRDRPSHLRSFRDGWRHLCFLLVLCPRWLYRTPAGLLLFVGVFLMIWLTPGPQPLGAVVFDVHTMLLGSMCVVFGYQLLWLGICASAFGRNSGLLSRDSGPPLGLNHLLDRCMAGGAILILLGLGLNSWLIRQWYLCDLGPLNLQFTLRYALWGFTSMVVGAQTIYSGFFMGLLSMAPQASPLNISPQRESRCEEGR